MPNPHRSVRLRGLVHRATLWFSGFGVMVVVFLMIRGEPLVLLRAAEPESGQGNLMSNGGVEETGGDGLPAGYQKAVYGAAPTIGFDQEVFRQGRQSMRVSADQASDTAIAQDLQLKPGSTYRFCGWVRTDQLAPEERSWTHGTFQIQDSQGRPIARLNNHKGTTDWTLEKVFFVAPDDGKVHVVCFFVGYGKGTGTAWFDDLQVTEAPTSNKIVVTAQRLQKESISPLVYGNFMELLSDLVPSMWAEKLDITSFEYLRTPQERQLRQSRFSFDPKYDPQDRHWVSVGEKGKAQWLLDADRPLNGQVSQRIRLETGGKEAGIAQGGIAVEKGESYRFVGHFRQRGLASPAQVELRRGQELLARATIGGIGEDWSEHSVTLTPMATATDATFVVSITLPGTLWVDRVSLVPVKNVSGWRSDVIAAMKAMKPGIIRWGGSVIEGYDWRSGIGPWQQRVPFPNRYWGRVDPNFVGIDEFVAFCRAVEAEPLICLRWTGQKPADAAAMVEYCNGGPDSAMGALRARNGHREPYGVKYWQIANELSGQAYDASFADFARALRKADPAIKILTAFPSEQLLKNAAELIDYVCPHHYNCADLEGTEADIEHFAEMLNRLAPGRPIKLAVTEWNTTAGDWGRDRHHLWTLQNGLICARYWNLCQRHADLVKIACRSNMANSYCSGIIQTNNHQVYGTPAYHVSRLYAEHGGAIPLALDGEAPLMDVDVSANLSEDGKSLSLIVVNYRGKPSEKRIHIGAVGHVAPQAQVWTVADGDGAGDLEATNSFERPDRIGARAASLESVSDGYSYTFPAYSVTLMKLGVQQSE